MNRPAKGFVPTGGGASPFFALFARAAGEEPVCRILEGPLESFEFEGSHGSPAPNAGLPRFRECSFSSAYPFGRVMLRDPEVPLEVDLKAFNPLVPADAETSGIPVAVLTYELRNPTDRAVEASVCGTVPNFVGMDGFETRRDWKGDTLPTGASKNRNVFRQGAACRGLFFDSEGVEPRSAAWGTMALVTTAAEGVTHRTSWAKQEWGFPILDFWDDFSADGRLDEREKPEGLDAPVGSLAVAVEVPPRATRAVTFVLAWHFPNRYTWTPRDTDDDLIGNHYTTLYRDAWDVAERTAPRLEELQRRTAGFVSSVCGSDLPEEVKEAALFNVSTLRTQTCFRTPDGRFFGWEGSASSKGCCHGSCTHVWNYEQATPFLFGELALSMREVEFGFATSDDGLMSFRVGLPLDRGQEFGKAAADGQMGCILKMYRDWQLSGDEALLRAALAEGPQGGGVLLDRGRLGRRPGRGDGGRPAQHDGCRVLRPEPADGHLVPGRPAGGGGDGAPPGRSRLRRHLPRALRERASLDRREPLQRRVLRAPGPGPEGRLRDRPEPPDRHGRGRRRAARLPARRRLPGRSARGPVPGPRVRPGPPRGPGEGAADPPEHPPLQPEEET